MSPSRAARTPVSRLRSAFGPTTPDDELHLGDILRQETVGGLLMLAATLLALLWANLSPTSYEQISHFQLGPMSVAHWASDGLLTIFFFVAGLELKRELVEGSLRRPAQALVPITAAICGMAFPALIYIGVNLVGHGALHGWAIPMATDIAFALAVLAIVGSNLPKSVRGFLLTLAIVDDLGVILVIALCFASHLNLWWLLGALACLAVWRALHHSKIRALPLYLLLGVGAWWCTYSSGIHATIAGVALGLLVPSSLADKQDAVDRWEHHVRPISAGLAVPLFALFAAGVNISLDALHDVITRPVGLGILMGLAIGKLTGVFTGVYATVRLTSAELHGTRWREVLASAQLAGIGFTVSLLMVELAFAGHPELAEQGKAAVLLASLISAIVGGGALARRSHIRGKAAAQAADG